MHNTNENKLKDGLGRVSSSFSIRRTVFDELEGKIRKADIRSIDRDKLLEILNRINVNPLISDFERRLAKIEYEDDLSDEEKKKLWTLESQVNELRSKILSEEIEYRIKIIPTILSSNPERNLSTIPVSDMESLFSTLEKIIETLRENIRNRLTLHEMKQRNKSSKRLERAATISLVCTVVLVFLTAWMVSMQYLFSINN